MKEMVGGCCVCSDERGWDENPLVYCDGQACNVAVHQACYGIVTVPSGPWFCRKCESQERSARVRCELCPYKDGALKRTDGSGGWAHVVCALYIPEVRFGNVTTMEPILISLIPPERFNKICYICEENSSKGSNRANFGACMQCNKPGCKQNFHVTCAQMLGLLCEEAGNMMDNVKYCGYCQYHYSKLKKTSNMKIIPPFRPVSNNPHHHQSADSSSSEVAKGNQISPDINKMTSLKKKLSGSSSTSSSSKSSTSSHISSSSTMPRIAPSNLFSSNSFASSLSKNASNESGPHEAKEDSYVLKSDDLKNAGNNVNTNGDGKKFLKTNDFMTVKLNDVLAASLDRPIHETVPRDKSQPPDIKPHVTLTPIPLRSSDKGSEKTTVLFGQAPATISKAGSKESAHIGPTSDIENSMAEISPKLSSESSLSPTKRQSESRTQRQEDTRSSGSERGTASSNWDTVKSQSVTPSARASSDEQHVPLPTSNQVAAEDVSKEPEHVEISHQAQVPIKRGPGRPVKRRSGPGREDERLDDHHLRKKSKRGGRRGLGVGYSSRRDEITEPPVLEDNSNYESKHHVHRKSSNATPKTPEEITPTLSQIQASKLESSSTVLPAHMFGNALNPASSMAQRMVDTLSQEMETMVAAGVAFEKDEKPSDKLTGIPVPKFSASLVSGSRSLDSTPAPTIPTSATASSNGSPPQTLEQLLERQWEQGSQFLMEQAQHLDIAQLLSCLNQLKQDNRALEEHVSSLIQRKEQLMAINARLSIPLGNSVTAIAVNPTNTENARSLTDQNQSQSAPNGRSVNYGGLAVPVASSHPSPHLGQNAGQGSR